MDFFNIKELMLKYTKSKKVMSFFLLFVLGFFLLLFPFGISDKEQILTDDKEEYIISSEEKRLEKMLLSVDGIKKANVMICFRDKGIKEYYSNESEDREEENVRSDKKIVVTRNGGNEMPVMKREISPEISGVSIVADCKKRGMEDVIYKLSSKALGVDIHKIEVIINDRS